jgi:hypothetical protein
MFIASAPVLGWIKYGQRSKSVNTAPGVAFSIKSDVESILSKLFSEF